MSDVDLLARAAAGDRLAFGELYDRHVRPVYWQAYSVVHDGAEAEDVTQDVFVIAWRRIRAITVVDDSVLPWLLVTARYTALNAQRRAARRRADELVETPGGVDVEREVEAAHVRAEIEKAVALLSPTDRRLYELCVDGDRTYEQAAADLGVTHAVVRNRLHRLRTRLRADLRSMRETS
ncbi:RNA polymerase sigma factor [Aeromicrobium terrae]|uniref:RNA polymerase sigma factor n=1 Tax=Aeromicrobium terrae TaxID=2498846 RepID=A0A5C8NLW4_9ACTN|nr:RNA polymerase sigma factor [Aeromicrobium terrae]TXL62136.1 RNA polymerase sigma factor [Aeromicrobium terrae]